MHLKRLCFICPQSPSNRIYNSNSYEDGEFLLTLNSPVEEGTYTCHLHNIDHTARCLEISSTLDFGGEVYVNADAVQYTISQTNCSQPQRLQDMTSAWELLMNHSKSVWASSRNQLCYYYFVIFPKRLLQFITKQTCISPCALKH